jgi:hypothetical protein
LLNKLIATIIIVTTLAMGAAGAQSTPPRSEIRVPFKVGEMLTYDVSWSSYLTAGTVTLTVQDKHPSYNSMAYYVVAEARPTTLMSRLYTLYYKADALIDVYNMLPQRASVYSEEGKRHLMKVTLFNQNAHKATFENTAAKGARQEFAVPAYAQDALSAVYVLRALPLKAGAHTAIPVSTAGHAYRAEVYVDALESVKAPAGTFQAWRLRAVPFNERGQPQGKPLLLWVSDTPSHVPVKLQSELAIGSFNLTLSNIRIGGS